MINRWISRYKVRGLVETKHNGGRPPKIYLRRPKCKRIIPSYTRAAFKQGGVKGVMVCGCFSGISGFGPLFQINGIIDRFVYRDILEKQMAPFADDNMALRWQFQEDNDPKHTSKLIKTWVILTKLVYRNGQLAHRTLAY